MNIAQSYFSARARIILQGERFVLSISTMAKNVKKVTASPTSSVFESEFHRYSRHASVSPSHSQVDSAEGSDTFSDDDGISTTTLSTKAKKKLAAAKKAKLAAQAKVALKRAAAVAKKDEGRLMFQSTKAKPPPQPTREYMMQVLERNEPLYRAMVTLDINVMLEEAGCNLMNTENIDFMEWSEMVFIQLCSPKTLVNLNNYMWSTMVVFIDERQWSLDARANFIKYRKNGTTLLDTILKNRAFKNEYCLTKYGRLMLESEIFLEQPMINFPLIKSNSISSEKFEMPFTPSRFRVKKKTEPELSVSEAIKAVRSTHKYDAENSSVLVCKAEHENPEMSSSNLETYDA